MGEASIRDANAIERVSIDRDESVVSLNASPARLWAIRRGGAFAFDIGAVLVERLLHVSDGSNLVTATFLALGTVLGWILCDDVIKPILAAPERRHALGSAIVTVGVIAGPLIGIDAAVSALRGAPAISISNYESTRGSYGSVDTSEHPSRAYDLSGSRAIYEAAHRHDLDAYETNVTIASKAGACSDGEPERCPSDPNFEGFSATQRAIMSVRSKKTSLPVPGTTISLSSDEANLDAAVSASVAAHPDMGYGAYGPPPDADLPSGGLYYR